MAEPTSHSSQNTATAAGPSWMKLQFSMATLLALIALTAIFLPLILEWKFSDRIPVESSNIASIGHNPYTGTMEVEFVNGRVYQYSKVPRQVYKDFLDADSHGKYFDREIKKSDYEYEMVR